MSFELTLCFPKWVAEIKTMFIWKSEADSAVKSETATCRVNRGQTRQRAAFIRWYLAGSHAFTFNVAGMCKGRSKSFQSPLPLCMWAHHTLTSVHNTHSQTTEQCFLMVWSHTRSLWPKWGHFWKNKSMQRWLFSLNWSHTRVMCMSNQIRKGPAHAEDSRLRLHKNIQQTNSNMFHLQRIQFTNTVRSPQAEGGATLKEPVVCIQYMLTHTHTQIHTHLLSGLWVEQKCNPCVWGWVTSPLHFFRHKTSVSCGWQIYKVLQSEFICRDISTQEHERQVWDTH